MAAENDALRRELTDERAAHARHTPALLLSQTKSTLTPHHHRVVERQRVLRTVMTTVCAQQGLSLDALVSAATNP